MNVKIIRIQETRPSQIPEHYIIMNAPRPLAGQDDWTGEFQHGIFYAAVDPSPSRSGYLAFLQNVQRDGWTVEYITEEFIQATVKQYVTEKDFDFAELDAKDINDLFWSHFRTYEEEIEACWTRLTTEPKAAVMETTIIQSIQHLWAHYTGSQIPTPEQLPDNSALSTLQRLLYKNTTCGMFIEIHQQTESRITAIAIGSIVEGSDAQTQTYIYNFPFHFSDFDEDIDRIETEATNLWDEANSENDEQSREPLLITIDVTRDTHPDSMLIQLEGYAMQLALNWFARKITYIGVSFYLYYQPATENSGGKLMIAIENAPLMKMWQLVRPPLSANWTEEQAKEFIYAALIKLPILKPPASDSSELYNYGDARTIYGTFKNLTKPENDFLAHMSRYGRDGYPIQRLGRKWQWTDFWGIKGAPVLYKTKRECTEAIERYLDILRSKAGGRLDASHGSVAYPNLTK